MHERVETPRVRVTMATATDFLPPEQRFTMGNQNSLEMIGRGVVQRLSVKASVSAEGDTYWVESIEICGSRLPTGYMIQGNHTISEAAIRRYQEMMTKNQPLTDVLRFYQNMVHELQVEYEFLCTKENSKGKVTCTDRKKNFDDAVNMFQTAMEKFSNSRTLSENEVLTNLKSLVEEYNRVYALSALSVDGLKSTMGKGEAVGTRYMRDAYESVDRSVDLLKLLTLLDFDALNVSSPDDYKTKDLLECFKNGLPDGQAVTPTMMGLPFDGNLAVKALGIQTMKSALDFNPVVTRLFLMAHQIAGRKKNPRGIEEHQGPVAFGFVVGNPQNTDEVVYNALTNMTVDLANMLTKSGNISPLLSKPLHMDSSRKEFPYPFTSSDEKDEVISNLATIAANTVSESLYWEQNDVTSKRGAVKTKVLFFLQGISICEPDYFKNIMKELRGVLNEKKGLELEQEEREEYIQRYKIIFELLCKLIRLPKYCGMVKECSDS